MKQWVCGLEQSLELWLGGARRDEVIAKVNVGQ